MRKPLLLLQQARPFYCQMLQEEVQGVEKKTGPVDVCAVILNDNDIGHELHLSLNVLVATLDSWTN